MESEYRVADMAAEGPRRTARRVVRDIWVSCQPNQSAARRAVFHIGSRSTPNSRALPAGLPTGRKNDQFVTSVVIRLGTSPTGMTALTVLLSVSMAVTDFMAALGM